METIHLIGAEQVQSAARTMSGVADKMSQVALNLDGIFERHQRFLDDWLQRFEALMEREIVQEIPAAPRPLEDLIDPEAEKDNAMEAARATQCQKEEWCGFPAGHQGSCNEDNLPF